LMSKTLATFIACGLILGPTFAAAADQPDKEAVKQATATCRAEVKEHAKYNEMSLWAQHKAVKKCVKEALAKH
jgi:stress-induced morphogen